MIKHGEKERNKLRLAAAIIVLLFVLLATVSGVTFAKLYGDGESDGAPATVATPVALSYYKAIYRTDSAGKTETVGFSGGAGSVTVNDVEPRDTLDIYYAITDSDGVRHNEVLLKATVTLGIKLVMKMNSGSIQTEYFEGWKEYAPADGVKNGGLLQVYGVAGGAEHEIRASQVSGGKVDYSGSTLIVEKVGDEIANKFGFYISPEEGTVNEYVYHFRFRLPEQGSETESYAGARLYIDINALFEQSFGNI